MLMQSRAIPEPTRVLFSGPGTLRIVQEEIVSLRVTGPPALMPGLTSECRNGVLRLGYNAGAVVSLADMRTNVRWELGVRDIDSVSATGNGNILLPDLDSDALEVISRGSGAITIQHLTADKLQIRLDGIGLIEVAGDVEAQEVVISGAGRYEAMGLVSDCGFIRLSGSGSARVAVSDNLDVSISGGGKVSYVGYPEITKRISGKGELTRLRRPARV